MVTVALAAPLQSQEAASPPVTLQPGDLIAVEIWQEPDLSGTFLIDESGIVTLPMIGARRVAGIGTAAIRDTLIASYRAELRNPSIQVTPLRRIYVLGEVNEPGLLNVDPTISLAGAVALAGGANENGDLRQLQVIRDGVVIIDEPPSASALGAIDIRSGDQIFVGRRGWFDRNSTFIVSALLSVTSVIITLAR